MRKPVILSFVILILLAFTAISSFSYDPVPPPGEANGPGYEGRVNGFEDFPSCMGETETAPVGNSMDLNSWIMIGSPLPTISDLTTDTSGIPVPGTVDGCEAGRVPWSNLNQYIVLKSDKFEDYGNTLSPYTQAAAKDWSNWDSVGVSFFMNSNVNFCSNPAISQKVSLYDGNMTVTSFPMKIDCESGGAWVHHVTLSMNYLKNTYDPASGKYFDPTNVLRYIINAPTNAYPGTWPNGQLVMYYDLVTLGAQEMPNSAPSVLFDAIAGSGAPAGVTVTVNWNTVTQNGTDPITAYHIFRSTGPDGPYTSLGFASNAVTSFSDTTIAVAGINYYYKVLADSGGPASFGFPGGGTQIANKINGTFHEVLLANATVVLAALPTFSPTNTPSNTATQSVTPTMTQTSTPSPTVTKTNTLSPTPSVTQSITASSTPTGTPTFSPTASLTYTITPTSSITQTVTFSPTITMTATITITPWPPGVATWTATATTTASPMPTVADTGGALANAWVYPNPFNPNAGTKKFKIGNVPDKTKIQIFTMDGALVTDGEVKNGYSWDGKNKNGSKVVTGLYYLILKTPKNEISVKRVIVCYKCNPVDDGSGN